jgi:hypothetical protein
MIRTYNEQIAKEMAKEKNLSYGFCIFDCKYYVGSNTHLKQIGCINIIKG